MRPCAEDAEQMIVGTHLAREVPISVQRIDERSAKGGGDCVGDRITRVQPGKRRAQLADLGHRFCGLGFRLWGVELSLQIWITDFGTQGLLLFVARLPRKQMGASKRTDSRKWHLFRAMYSLNFLYFGQ